MIKIQQYKIGQILSEGWMLYSQNFRVILPVILIVYIPINILLSLIPVDNLIETQGFKGFRIYMRIIQLSEFLMGTIATIAIAIT